MAMITAGDFRNGVTFEMEGKVMQVVEQGHLDLRAGLQGGGLGDVGGGVALHAGVGLGDHQLHEVGGLHAEHAALVGHDLAGRGPQGHGVQL